MENIMRTKLTACALVTTLAITGCANMNDTQKKTATGAGAGAVAGAVLGAVTGPGGWGRAAAVSYTHLDVYKRQLSYWMKRHRPWTTNLKP